MKAFKRFMALMLCLAMTLTLFAGLTLTASAADPISSTAKWTETAFADIENGATVIIGNSNNKALPSTTTSGSPTKTAITVTGAAGSLTVTPGSGTLDSLAWTFDKSSSTGTRIFQYGSSSVNLYLTSTGSNTALRVGTGTSNNLFVMGNGNKLLKVTTAARYVGEYVSGSDWRTYNSEAAGNYSGQSLKFYVLNAAAPSYAVSAVSNNNSFGTVAYSNNTITATPANGYYVTGTYAVNPSGAATVAYNNDNTFTVSNVTANCTITVNFAQKQSATLTYSENGATHNHSGTNYVGDTVSLATPIAANTPAGYTFMGWLPTTYATSNTAPTALLAAGENYTLSGTSNTLYAVYAVQSGTGGSGNEYQLVSAAKTDWSGTYVIADKNSGHVLDYATSTTAGNASTVSSAGITLNSGVMTNVAERYTVTLGKTGNNYYVKLNGAASDTYLNLTANSNTVGKGNSYSAITGQWTVTWDTDGVHLFNASYTTRELQKNNSGAYFRCYTGTQTDIVLYEQQAGATYSGYTTSVSQEATYYTLTYTADPTAGGTISCDPVTASGASVEEGELVMLTATPAEHYTFGGWTVTGISANDYEADGADLMLTMNNNVTVTANFTEEATYTVTVNQPAIGGGISASKNTAYAGETITLTAAPAAHYSFASWTVSGATPASTTAASTTFIMPAANVTVTASFTEDEKYTVSFYESDTDTTPTTLLYYVGTAIPAADVPTITAPEGFVFKGWYNATYNNAAAPAYVTPAGTIVNSDLTFRAVYGELGEGGSGTGNFEKLESSLEDYSGNYIFAGIKSQTYYAMNPSLPGGTSSGQIGHADSVYDISDIISSDKKSISETIDEAYVVTISKSGSGYTLQDAAGEYIGNTSGTALTKNDTATASCIWTISVSSGNVTLTNTSSGLALLFNANSTNVFRTYSGKTSGSGGYTLYLYKQNGGASIENYTTNPVATKITVTWRSGTEIFKTERVEFGTTIAAPATNPEKTEAEMEYYTFAGWSETEGGTLVTSFPTASAQLGDKTYYAVFTTVSKLTVTWNNYDNTTLDTEYYRAGETPTYKGEEPTKPATSSFYYSFSGWNPTVSPVTAAITYTATFEEHDRFELTASLSKSTIKVDRYATVNYTLTDTGVETTTHTPTITVAPTTVAQLDTNGRVKGLTPGTAVVTISFADVLDSQGQPLSISLNLTVVENAATGGYTLITQDNAPTDWSGDYIIMGKPAGDTTYMNTWMLLTPNYDGSSVAIADNNEDAATITLTDDGSGIGTGTINDEGNASSGVDKNITMEDTGLVTDLNDDDSILVYDTITEIDDAYAFTVECIDDINQIYTIRVKDTNLYIACSPNTGSGSNSLNFDSSATELAQWQFSVQRVTKGGYNNDIITAQNVGNPTRRLYFNSNQYGVVNGQFRDYHSTAYGSLVGGNASGVGQAYNLYLFGNPNPFKAQIYFHGDQVTLVDTAEVPVNAATAQLTSALMPDIAGYPNWQQVGEPTWSIIENSNGNQMSIAQDGTVTLNSSIVGSYALVQVSYTVRDLINNTDQLVSTVAKVEVIASSQTYSTVIYETYSGADTEVQYTINNSVTALPLAAYVVNDITNDNSKTGNVVMGGTLNWSAVKNSGNTQATVSISSDGILHLSNFTADGIVTVTVSGATGDNVNAAAGTFKVYVKAITYQTTIIKAANATTGTYDANTDTITYSGTETNGNLAYNVLNSDNQGPGPNTFSLFGGAWSISGDNCGVTINSAGYLDFTNVDRSEDHTITVLLSSLSATANGVTTTNLSDTITVVIEKQTVVQVLEAADDIVLIDWALPVTFDVTTNDNYNVTVTVSNGTLPTGVSANGNGSFTYTPTGWQTQDRTFTYTLSGTVNGVPASATATVTLKTADSVYYEDTYSDIFTFVGNWTNVADGSPVAAQTSSLDTADIFEYDANHAAYAQYSGGTAKMVTVSKGIKPTVSFSFAGTGFDIISATTNNTGAIKLTVTGEGFAGINQIIDTFRGYAYVEGGYTRYGLKTVERFKPDGENYIKYNAETATDELSNYNYYFDTETSAYVENTTWYSGDVTKYYDSVNSLTEDANGFCIVQQFTSNWQPATNGEGTDFYQIPILKVTDLPYGTYTVTVTPTYSAAYDRVGDGSYDFFFDGVRIHNPVDRAAEYKYISIHDAVAEDGFGAGEIVECTHEGQPLTDWTFYARARNTNSSVTCNRGAYVRYCTYCGGVADTAYFHVNVTADATQLGVGGYNNLPATTVLRYTLTADAGEAQAAVQAKLDTIHSTLTEYWASNTAAVMTCMNNTNTVIANGNGTTYATLQLKDPATQTIYASAIHSPDITVIADDTHVHTFGAWAHDADSNPSTHTRSCTDAACSFYETEACAFTSAVTTEATATTDGVRTYTCGVCNYTYTEVIPATGSTQPTATFHVPEGATAPAAQTGETVTMPAAVVAPVAFDAQAYTFVGWIANELTDTTATQTYYAAGAEATISEDTDFYALYTYTGTAGGNNTFTKVTSELGDWSGNYMIVSNGTTPYALTPTFYSGSSGEFNGTAVTVSGNKITNNNQDLVWTIAPTETENEYTVSNSNGYLAITGTSSTSAALTQTADDSFTIGFTDSTDNAKLLSTNNNNTRVFSFYTGRNTFRTYASSNVTGFLFKQDAETYFTTALKKACTHEDYTSVVTAPTCIAGGYTTYTCTECGHVWTGAEVAAIGHDYGTAYTNNQNSTHSRSCSRCSDVLTEDCTFGEGVVNGSIVTYTCTACGYSYSETTDFAVSYIVPTGVTYTGGSRNGNAVTLPSSVTIPATYNAHSYTFVGWAETIGEDSTTEPTNHEPGDIVNLTEDTVFYPVFSYTAGGGTGGWTRASSIAVGDVVILVCEDVSMEMSSISTTSTKYGIGTSFATAPAGTLPLTVEAGSATGSFAFKNDGKYLYWNSGNSLNLYTSTVTASTSWTVDFTTDASQNHVAINNVGTASREILWNKSAPRFAAYTSSVGSSYLAVQIYKLSSGSGETTYTFTLAAQQQSNNYVAAISPASLTLAYDSTATVTATLTNNGLPATIQSVTYSSNDENLVVVDNNGELFTGDTSGTATITATITAEDNSTHTATCIVRVIDPNAAVTVNYIGTQTGKVYNWGSRGTTATFLTAPADDYYTGSYSFDTLYALNGDSGTGTAFYSSPLGTAIHNMLVAKQTTITNYEAGKTNFKYTECEGSDQSYISSYYSGTQMNNWWDGTWNREHTWPNSKGLDGQDENDMLMLKPTLMTENSSRGNTAYGQSGSFYDPNSLGQSLRGDTARLMLQHLMRWGNTSHFYGSAGVMESRAVLIQWMIEDPVDTWELGRNDAMERISGIRNVFVDYPELAFKLLGATMPVNYQTPSKSGVIAEATYSATMGSGYTPVTAASAHNAAPRSTYNTAKSSVPNGPFNGAVIIDGKGTSNTKDDFAAYGPNYGVYLAPGQGIVFSLTSDVTEFDSQDLQIGAKAVNGTATTIDVASISNGNISSGIKYLLNNQAIASATEMYYELDTEQMGWQNGESSVIVIYNAGSGVLAVTNLRYSTVNNNTLTMNINDVQTQNARKMLQVVYGEPETQADPIKTEPTPATLNFESASLMLQSDISMLFYVAADVYNSVAEPYAVFTKARYNEQGEVIGNETVTVSDAAVTGNGASYCFRFDGINPAEMGSEVTATLYGSRDGQLLQGNTLDYSVLTYVNRMSKTNEGSFRTLLADLICYGAAAQLYVNYNTENLVTDRVSPELLACATKNQPTLTSCTAMTANEHESVRFTAAYLTLREKVTVCYKMDTSAFAGSVEALELRIRYRDINGQEKTAVISGADFVGADGKFIASFSGLNAIQMRTVLCAEVYAGETCVSSRLLYSIESYAQSKSQGSDCLANLVNAMMKFGDSAMAFFAQ